MQLGSMLFGSFVIETKLFGPMTLFTHEKITIVIMYVTAIVKNFFLIIIIANKIENHHDHDCKIALLPGPPSSPKPLSPRPLKISRFFFSSPAPIFILSSFSWGPYELGSSYVHLCLGL